MTIGLAPSFHLFGLELAWHGVFAALGLLAGVGLAWWLAPRLGGERGVLEGTALVMGLAGIVGARIWYLLENDRGNLFTPWAGGREGFSFWGAVVFAAPAAAIFLWRARVPVLANLDLIALGFAAGMTVGRFADLINGEHYGPPTDLPWGITYTNPESHVPQTGVAYHSGALYEIVLAAVLLVVGLVLVRRLPRPGDLFWIVLAGYAAGRFAIFFIVRDADVVALGLRQAQWTSLAVLVVAGTGFWITRRRSPDRSAPVSAPG